MKNDTIHGMTAAKFHTACKKHKVSIVQSKQMMVMLYCYQLLREWLFDMTWLCAHKEILRDKVALLITVFENLPVTVTGRKQFQTVTLEIVPDSDRWPAAEFIQGLYSRTS